MSVQINRLLNDFHFALGELGIASGGLGAAPTAVIETMRTAANKIDGLDAQQLVAHSSAATGALGDKGTAFSSVLATLGSGSSGMQLAGGNMTSTIEAMQSDHDRDCERTRELAVETQCCCEALEDIQDSSEIGLSEILGAAIPIVQVISRIMRVHPVMRIAGMISSVAKMVIEPTVAAFMSTVQNRDEAIESCYEEFLNRCRPLCDDDEHDGPDQGPYDPAPPSGRRPDTKPDGDQLRPRPDDRGVDTSDDDIVAPQPQPAPPLSDDSNVDDCPPPQPTVPKTVAPQPTPAPVAEPTEPAAKPEPCPPEESTPKPSLKEQTPPVVETAPPGGSDDCDPPAKPVADPPVQPASVEPAPSPVPAAPPTATSCEIDTSCIGTLAQAGAGIARMGMELLCTTAERILEELQCDPAPVEPAVSQECLPDEEPVVEPVVEPVAESSSECPPEPAATPEPSAEPEPKPEPEPDPEPETITQPLPEHAVDKKQFTAPLPENPQPAAAPPPTPPPAADPSPPPPPAADDQHTGTTHRMGQW